MGCDDQKQLVLNAQERYISTTNMMDMREKTEKFWREQIAQEIEMSSPMVMAKDYAESELVEYIIGKCADIAKGNNG